MAQACQARFWAPRVGSGAVLEAFLLVAGLDDVAVVGEPVEERGGHLGVAGDAGRGPPNARLVVTITEVRSSKLRLIRSKSSCPPDWAKGR